MLVCKYNYCLTPAGFHTEVVGGAHSAGGGGGGGIMLWPAFDTCVY